MAEIAALGQAAHVEDATSVGRESRAPAPPTIVGASQSACTHQLCSTVCFSGAGVALVVDVADIVLLSNSNSLCESH